MVALSASGRGRRAVCDSRANRSHVAPSQKCNTAKCEGAYRAEAPNPNWPPPLFALLKEGKYVIDQPATREHVLGGRIPSRAGMRRNVGLGEGDRDGVGNDHAAAPGMARE